ncbi:DUF3021 domain-containing protein [Bifidobacterium sp. ESL0745]|uniref:DUF3021 domain-containing protein n=1 Tax=Bifidobacterium sp. ESL0745 TaxID=2983226 RepID=UPI0023F93774|nr:DUF3021 domain-containing protein [Bifidobacterium sp. ESL0745]MDF7666136.1 DUF3021 domain-containing protein [Bifidobacterium sp. ESL0745]
MQRNEYSINRDIDKNDSDIIDDIPGNHRHDGDKKGEIMAHLPTILRDIARNAAIGLGFGSFFYLLVGVIAPGWVPVNTFSIVTLFVMSALIGELTFLLGNGRISGYIAHCVLTFALVIAWILVNGWSFSHITGGLPTVVLVFILIYAAIWTISIAHNKLDARKINERLTKQR